MINKIKIILGKIKKKISILFKSNKKRIKINTLQNKIDTLEDIIKSDLYKEFMSYINQDTNVEKIKKENKRLKEQNKKLKKELEK